MKNGISVDFKEIKEGENWEFFARDYLAKLGFVVEIGPGRGHDHGKDLLITEQMNGKIITKKFTWLVSCKHNAISNKSVGVNEENNILERISEHAADGFMGFYSTLASSSLIDRLKTLVKEQKLAAFEIIDKGKIEAKFYREGLSDLAGRYFPKSYKHIKPIQAIWREYEPLECEACGEVILIKEILTPRQAIIVYAKKSSVYCSQEKMSENYKNIHNVYTVCKGKCDQQLNEWLREQGYFTTWIDIGDLCNPILFMQSIVSYMNSIRSNDKIFTDEAHEKIKGIYIIMAQRILREATVEDQEDARRRGVINASLDNLINARFRA